MITKRSETCRCGGSIVLEGDGKDNEMRQEIWDWRQLHNFCDKSPHFFDKSGSTYMVSNFGFSKNYDRSPAVG